MVSWTRVRSAERHLPDAIFFQAEQAVSLVRPAHVFLAWGQPRLDSTFPFPDMFGRTRSLTRQQQAHLVDQMVVGLILVIVAQAVFQLLVIVWKRDFWPV